MQILLTIAYDGTNYAGWQRQKNGIAVQEKIEDALEILHQRKIFTRTACGENRGHMVMPAHSLEAGCGGAEQNNLVGVTNRIVLRAASRTDAGVHAMGQRAAFFAENLLMPVEKLPLVINALLPEDISIMAAEIVPEDFHPQFHTTKKTYVYSFITSPNPLQRRYAVFVPHCPDISAMQEAAAHFIGRHDFAAFCAVGGSAKTTVREIFACEVFSQSPGSISLSVTGSGFLYNMVRIIAGTVLYAGLGKIPPHSIPQIIAEKNRTKAGKTMPPQGLVLLEVLYE